MNEVYVGIALLISIVLAQFAAGRIKRQRIVSAWNAAQEAMREGRLEEAERALARCVALAPLWVQGAVAQGIVQGQLGKTAEAEALLLRAKELHPKEGDPDYGLGMLYATACEGREAEAVEAFQRAIALNPEFASAIAGDARLDALRTRADFPVAARRAP